jgi:predicted transcriptional regulator
VAFQLDDESLRLIDALVAAESSSRAAILRVAVQMVLHQRREAAIDEQLGATYAAEPPAPQEEAVAELSVHVRASRCSTR